MPRPKVAQRAKYYAEQAKKPSKYSYDKPGPFGKVGRAVGGLAGGLTGAALAALALSDPTVAHAAKALGVGGKYGAKFIGSGGASAGAAIGSKIGSYAHYIGKIFGSGDYVTASQGVVGNSLMNAGQIPSFAGKNEVRIRHREYLGDIVSSATAGAFQLQSFPINPGVGATFPWLSQVCGATFQQYRLNGMVYEYRSMSANALNSTNTALGSVVMATDYDSKDAAFTSKQQMENTEFGVSCKPSMSMIHAIECKRSQTPVSELYIRAFSVPSGADPRLYDLGNFQVATVGMQGTSVNCGELWCSYDVTLLKTIEQPPAFMSPYAKYDLVVADLATKPIEINTAVPSATLPANFDNIGLSVDSTGLILTFPSTILDKSIWMVWLHHAATAGGAAAVTVATMTGSNGLANFNPIGATRVSEPNPSPGPATQRGMDVLGYFQYTNPRDGTLPTITFVASTVPFGTYSGGSLQVFAIPGNETHL